MTTRSEAYMASIRTRVSKSGVTTWAVLFNHEGRQRSRTFDNLKGAEKFRDLINASDASLALSLAEQQVAERRTVDDLFAEWLEVKRSDMTVEGHRDYQRAYAKWIKPTFGWRDAEAVTEVDVQQWVEKVLKPALGPKAIAKQHALLHGMFRWASSKTVRHIENDPCTETRLPKRRKRPPRGLTIPELHAVLTAGARTGMSDAADVVAVMAGTGWRPGEVMGLLAGSIDVMPNGYVYIVMTSVYRRSEGIVDSGKTDAAGRRLRVLGEGAAVLARRVVGRGVNDLVFPHPNPRRKKGEPIPPGRPWPPSSFSGHYWPKLIAAAGLTERGPTPYWLRHTHVAICHAAGLTLPEIQRRIGHEHISTTIDVYGRMIDGMSEESAARLDALLTPSPLPEVLTGDVLKIE